MLIPDASSVGTLPAVPQASIVIPSYQSSSSIRATLRSLIRQKTSIRYEIVVVDSSSDGTDQIVRNEFPAVRLIHFEQQRKVGTARNIGIKATQAPVVLFVDADTIPCDTWVDQMYQALTTGLADAVGGSISNGTPWSVTGSVGFYLEFFRFLEFNGEPRPVKYLVGGNSGYRREVLSTIEFVDRSLGEDMLLSSRLAREGKRLLFLPRASVKHQNKTGFRRVMRYQRKLGEGTFLYRSAEPADPLRLLRAFPWLALLLPFGVLPWIGGSILARRRTADFLRFIAVLPVSVVANSAWAYGLYQLLRRARRPSVAQEPSVRRSTTNSSA